MSIEKRCPELASIRRFWPGKDPDVVCLLHAHDTQKIATAMGFKIHMEPLTFDMNCLIENEEDIPACACTEGFSS